MSEPTRLAQLRRDRGWSQAALAEKSTVARTEISAIETGRLVPSVAVALRLAGALDERVETVFGPPADQPDIEWAWHPPRTEDRRVWRASVGRRRLVYPLEATAVGTIPHDGCHDGRAVRSLTTASSPDRTLVVAGCDPLVGLLAREIGAGYGVRVLPLLRSSAQALDLLRQGLVHAAGLHCTDEAGRSTNVRVVEATLGPGYRLIHQLRWDAGIAVATERRERTSRALLRAHVRWVNREDGSAARHAFDRLLGGRRRPSGYTHIVGDHRAVAATVSSGWAEAGVCVRPAAAEAHLSFIPLQQEAYELCLAESQLDDARIAALVATLQSVAYRRLVSDVPGCVSTETGDLRSVA